MTFIFINSVFRFQNALTEFDPHLKYETFSWCGDSRLRKRQGNATTKVIFRNYPRNGALASFLHGRGRRRRSGSSGCFRWRFFLSVRLRPREHAFAFVAQVSRIFNIIINTANTLKRLVVCCQNIKRYIHTIKCIKSRVFAFSPVFYAP